MTIRTTGTQCITPRYEFMADCSQMRSRVTTTKNLLTVLSAIVVIGRCWLYDGGTATTQPHVTGRALSSVAARDLPCAGVGKISGNRCEFVAEHCENESLVNYLYVYYCIVEPSGWIAKLGFQLACFFGVALLFRVLSTTAEDYFSPILTQMSKEFYLPPRLAGVTLMAWGNGAPDIFSSMAAVKSGEYQLALGGQLGAGMFIGTVVLGCVLGAGGGATMRGALIRDVSSYLLAVATVALIIHSGQVSRAKVAFILLGYVAYVLSVCAADVLHRVRRKSHGSPADVNEDSTDLEAGLLTPPDSPEDSPRPLEAGVAPLLLPRQFGQDRSPSTDQLSDRSIELQAQPLSAAADRATRPSVAAATGEPPPRAASLGAPGVEGLPSVHSLARPPRVRALPHPPAVSPLLSYSDIIHMPGSKYRERAWAALSDSPSFRKLRAQTTDAIRDEGGQYHPPTRASVDNSFLDTPDAAAAMASASEGSSADGGSPPSAAPAADSDSRLPGRSFVWRQAAHYATLRGFVEQHLLQRLLLVATLLEWPLTVARRATIPLLEQECYSRPWLIASMAGAPPAVAVYLRCGTASMVLAGLFGLVAAAAAHWTTRAPAAEDVPPDWACGLDFPVGAVAVALAGFVVACMWIDTVASELVGLLRFFGVLAHISSVVLGLTLLAWGNSIPDLITNVAMARTGYCNMAMTACFAGPLCNILCGLGLGFLLLLARDGSRTAAVQLSVPVLTDATIVCGNCALVLVLGLVNRGHLPARLATVLPCLYIVYLLINVVVRYT